MRVEKSDGQSDYDYDAFMSCSLDSTEAKVVKIYCFDRDKLAVVFYDNGDAEIVGQKIFQFFTNQTKQKERDNGGISYRSATFRPS